MDWGWIILLIAVVLGGATLIGFRYAKDPTRRGAAVEVADRADRDSDRLYSTADRPAGPDAEAMDPDVFGGDQSPPNTRRAHD